MPCWRLSLSGAPFPRRRGCRSIAGTFSGGDWVSNPLYPALLYLAQSFASILGMTLLVRSLLFPDAPAEELSGFLLPLLIALGLLLPLMTGISAGICRLARRRMGR